MKRFAYWGCSLLCISFLRAQQKNIYRAKIIADTLSSKSYLLSLKNLTDTTKVYSLSGKSTFFLTDFPSGNYERCVFESGKYKSVCDTLSLPIPSIDTIYIDKDNYIGKVEITAKKPLIRFNAEGAIELKVADNPLFSSSSLWELLIKMPGVTYNPASHSLRLNAEGVRIQLNGRETLLTGRELITYLKSISADQVKTIEINSTPSAKYEASGSAGIINIKMKKNKDRGVYASIKTSASQGRFFDESNAFNMQYNTPKSRYLFSYNNSFNKDFEQDKMIRAFSDKQKSLQNTYAKINGKSHNFNGEYKYAFKNTTFGIFSQALLYQEKIPQDTQLHFFSRQKISDPADSVNFSKNRAHNKLQHYSFGAYYTLKKTQSSLKAESYYFSYRLRRQSLLQSFTDSSPPGMIYPDLKNESPSRVKAWISKVDYTYKIDSTSQLESGIKALYQRFKNANHFFTKEGFDPNRSDEFHYREWVVGIYAQYYRTWNKKWNMVIGNRLEINPLKGATSFESVKAKKTFTNLFPYFNLSFQYDKEHQFRFSYNKRIARPAFKELLPYIYFVDPFTTLKGNPNLKPFISHKWQLQYLLKRKYIFSAGYTLRKNQIFQVPLLNDDFQSCLAPVNLKTGSRFTFSTNFPLTLFKWWQINIGETLFYDNNSLSENDLLTFKNHSWFSQSTVLNQITLPWKINLSFSANYISPFIQGPYQTQGLFWLNASLKKHFLKKKFEISLTANDILNTYEINNTLSTESTYFRQQQNLDNRWIRLSLSYRFKRGLKKSGKMHNKALLEQVKQRVK